MTTSQAQDGARDDSNRRASHEGYAVAVVVVGALVAACVLLAAAPAAAATQGGQGYMLNAGNNSTINNSEYYNGSKNVNNESWFDGIGDADLDSLGKLATRSVNYFIGTGSMDASGTGFQGVLITGIVMSASLLSAVAGLGIGSVGGSVIAVVVGFGMTELGLAPPWFRVLLLFGIGIVAYIALTNVMEAR